VSGAAGGRVRRALRAYLLATGLLTTVVLLWLASPLPLFIAAPLRVNEVPVKAEAIVCLGSGVDDGLPSPTGWHRVRTSARLYREGYAPVIVFSGGPVLDSAGRPVAEVYAEAARLLGVPASACLVEPLARNTADHPRRLLEMDFLASRGGRATPLLVVTSAFHGRRAALCFRKAGFTQVRIVVDHREVAPEALQASAFHRRFAYRLYALLAALEEWSAIALYKTRGWV
jgi:uncharacterized SAM-binding protein YcdF (DUF218 family)